MLVPKIHVEQDSKELVDHSDQRICRRAQHHATKPASVTIESVSIRQIHKS
jgi:hypothetical protein